MGISLKECARNESPCNILIMLVYAFSVKSVQYVSRDTDMCLFISISVTMIPAPAVFFAVVVVAASC